MVRIYEEWRSTLLPDNWPDAAAGASEYLIKTPEDRRDIGDACRQLMDEFVAPLINRSRTLLRKSIDDRARPYLDLAETLEQGLCRPDIGAWLTWNTTWPVLPSEALAQPHGISDDGVVTHEDSDPGSAVTGQFRNSLVLASRSYAPGGLAPHQDWLAGLVTDWNKTQLPDAVADVELHRNVRDLYNLRRLTNRTLAVYIDDCYDLLCSLVLSVSPSYERVQVDTVINQATVDGQPYKIDTSEAQVLHRLCAGARDQERPISQSDLEKLPACRGKKIRRVVKRLTGKIPKLANLIASVSGRGGGYRLK